MALKTTKLEQANPWIVEELEEFLYFCCPECDEKCQAKGHFFSDHSALTNRPDAKTQLSLTFFFEDLGFQRLEIIYSNIIE